MEETKITASITTDGASPWFSGHFPDNPILPGIAQLKMVFDLLAEECAGTLCMTGLSRVKFRKIVKPGEQLDIHVTPSKTKDQCMFRITSGNEDVCSGRMLFTRNQNITEETDLHEQRY
jgi:3-hydroxyacyl-[acyl-carrier-protein] dehydratase